MPAFQPASSTPPPAPIDRLRRLIAVSLTESHSHPVPSPADAASSASYSSQLHAAETALRRLIIDEELKITLLKSQSQSQTSSATQSFSNPPASAAPSPTQASPKSELAALQSLFPAPAYIPPPTSPLNTLLALRHVLNTITTSRTLLPTAKSHHSSALSTLSTAKQLLAEEQLLTSALEVRIAELRDRHPSSSASSSVNETQELVKLEKETRKLISGSMKALMKFIDHHLVPELEVEESGGAVTGAQPEPKAGETKSKRQKKIDEMFRKREEEGRGIGVEFKELLEELMNRCVEGGDPWVRVERESAGLRFLVRSEIAILNKRDARKVRLVDFASEFR
ncbi:hypothetical protein EX30DRAFT_394049 [Ascodesmis nigricans]|uniref:Centromere protein Cenp-K n=1 Tax=Ascodesmis nigricans TaxID=341454 RepID=A0A4S2N165_9PEZI|nr:hypothetical protein EX30DRAFT_394049 [Ascodesmis nigricans]